GLANIGTWVVGQLGMVTLALAWVWVAGLRFLWRSGRPLWRAMAWAYGLLFVLFAGTTGAKTYYLGAAYVYLLRAADIAWTYKSNPTLGETVGWPQFVRTVDGVWKSLPPRQRASTVIFTADYGESGAINELGRGTGLPTAVSGQNSEWWWGPGNPHATTVVAVAPGPIDVTGYVAHLRQFFTHVRVAATLSNPY